MMKKVLLVILGVVISVALYSQKSNKAFMNNFYDACAYMYEDNYDAALVLWQEAEKRDPDNPNVWYNLGVCYKNTAKDRELAIEYLKKALDYANPNYVPNDHTDRTAPLDAYGQYGVALRMVGRFDESIEALRQAREVASQHNKTAMVNSMEEEIITSKNAKMFSLQRSCHKIDVVNLGDEVNSEYTDHSPIIVCGGDKLYFTSKRPNSMNSEGDEKIYVTTKRGDSWSAPELLPAPINSKGNNESVVYVTPDGSQIFFFRSGSAMQGNLFVSKLDDNGKWGKPQALGFDINSKYRESHVTLSPDGNSLYFTSDRPGGFGGLDIYVIKKLPNGQWTEPILLPNEVNTAKDEECPFVHPNGSILYFSSKGHESVGGYDVFYSVIGEDGSYSKAESMCSPINTPDNDVSYTLSCDGLTAYVAAIREDTHGEYDIYEIADRGIDPNLIVYSGRVKYADEAIPKGVYVWIKDKTTGEDLGSYKVDETTGKYTCYMQPNDDFSITYSKSGNTLKEVAKTPTSEEESNFKRLGEPIDLGDMILPLYNKEAEMTLYDNDDLTGENINVLNGVISDAADLSKESRTLAVNLDIKDKSLTSDSRQIKSVTDYLTAKGINSSDITYNEKPDNKNVYNIKVTYSPNIIADNKNRNSNDDHGVPTVDGSDVLNPVLSDTIVIKNIYFDFDKSDIKSEYRQNLDVLAEYMKENPGAKIEIGGHTDYVGTNDYNYLLSGRRAKAVKDYLVSKGVKQDKIETAKYGESKPIASNSTNDTRKYNRRAEFRVLVQGSEKYLKIESDNVTTSSSTSKSVTTSSSTFKGYIVQIAALKNRRDVASFNVPNLKVRESNGFYKYYLGEFSTRAEAEAAFNAVKVAYPGAQLLEAK